MAVAPLQRNKKVLTVDDDRRLQRALRLGLEKSGYIVLQSEIGEHVQDLVALHSPNLLVLELVLPGMSGLELCRQLREWSNVPIIVTSKTVNEKVKIEALDLGADDYVVKPFGIGEMLARVRALLRRCDSNENEREEPEFSCDELAIDFVRRIVRVAGNEVHLTPKEYNLLKYMVSNANRLLTSRQLLQLFWGNSENNHTLRVHVANLRKKVELDPDNPRFILTETRLGYRFRTDHSPQIANLEMLAKTNKSHF